MSQLNIASMRKKNNLVINIALKKEDLEADQDLGSSRDDEKRSLESSVRRRDVFQGVCSKADEEIDDHPSARDHGVMREVDVGTGLSGALNLLREQGTFKELVGVVTDNYNHENDRFRDAFKEIRIDRVDECGRILTTKEAFRKLSHGFHGKKPGKRKQEKRKRKQEEDTSKQMMESSDRAVKRMRLLHAELKSPYIVL